MKKNLFLLPLFLISLKLSAQVTQPTNTVTNGNSYLGTANNYDVLFKRAGIEIGKLTTNTISFGQNSKALPKSVSIGTNAGQFSSTTTGLNTYIGNEAGKGFDSNTLNIGYFNTFIGGQAGVYNKKGYSNTSIGAYSGQSLGNGCNNVFVGYNSGSEWQTDESTFVGSNSGSDFNGTSNTFMGFNSGGTGSGDNNVHLGNYSGNSSNGSQNIYIGGNSGGESAGAYNICIGNSAGQSSVINNSIIIGNGLDANIIGNPNNNLIIENSESSKPLIWGDFATDQLKFNGKVGVGYGFGNYPTTAGSANISNYNLFVKGGILTEEVRVNLQTTWADYVFAKNYQLPTLTEVENHINEKGHLINVPSAKEVKENGIEMGEMFKIQQEKIEELTLYVIEQNKINEKQKQEIEELKAQMKLLLEKK